MASVYFNTLTVVIASPQYRIAACAVSKNVCWIGQLSGAAAADCQESRAFRESCQKGRSSGEPNDENQFPESEVILKPYGRSK